MTAFSVGSPLVVSLIGALLRDFPNRWDYYLRQLQNKQFKRIRKSSSYDYEALDEAMSISVEMLREDIKDYYTDLSIFPKDVKVPTKVIEGPTILVTGYLQNVTFDITLRTLSQRMLERYDPVTEMVDFRIQKPHCSRSPSRAWC